MLERKDIDKLCPERLVNGLMRNGVLKMFYYVDFIAINKCEGQLLLMDVLTRTYHAETISLIEWNRYELDMFIPQEKNPVRIIRKEVIEE